jgi:uncharacterized membrane protein
VVDQASAEKTDLLEQKPDITMIKRILILAAVIGLIAESSVFAADPTPAPSPAKGATTETASPSPSPAKTRRRGRVEARRTGRQERRTGRHEARQTRREARGPEASPTPAAKPSPTPKQ